MLVLLASFCCNRIIFHCLQCSIETACMILELLNFPSEFLFAAKVFEAKLRMADGSCFEEYIRGVGSTVCPRSLMALLMRVLQPMTA